MASIHVSILPWHQINGVSGLYAIKQNVVYIWCGKNCTPIKCIISSDLQNGTMYPYSDDFEAIDISSIKSTYWVGDATMNSALAINLDQNLLVIGINEDETKNLIQEILDQNNDTFQFDDDCNTSDSDEDNATSITPTHESANEDDVLSIYTDLTI